MQPQRRFPHCDCPHLISPIYQYHQYHRFIAMSDDEMPPLDDFEENLKTIQYTKKQTASKSSEDYTKPNLRHIEDEEKQKAELK